MAAEYIFTMRKVSRFYPPDREVLKDITLAFYPGAKIGVLGANGAGKSSLLKIMAGLDDDYSGEARLTPGFTVGYLAQEPQLDENLTVKENIELAVALVRTGHPVAQQILRGALWDDAWNRSVLAGGLMVEAHGDLVKRCL